MWDDKERKKLGEIFFRDKKPFIEPDPEFFEKVMEDQHIPENIKEKLWVMGKHIMLTNVSRRDIPYFRLLFDDILVAQDMAKPVFENTFDNALERIQSRVIFSAMLQKSLDFGERKLWHTERREAVYEDVSMKPKHQSGLKGAASKVFKFGR